MTPSHARDSFVEVPMSKDESKTSNQSTSKNKQSKKQPQPPPAAAISPDTLKGIKGNIDEGKANIKRATDHLNFWQDVVANHGTDFPLPCVNGVNGGIGWALFLLKDAQDNLDNSMSYADDLEPAGQGGS